MPTDFIILAVGQLDAEDAASLDLREVENELVDQGIAVESTRAPVPGIKDGLTLAISATGLTLSAISTVLSALSFAQAKHSEREQRKTARDSRRRKFSVSLKQAGQIYTMEKLTRAEMIQVAQRLDQDGSTVTAKLRSVADA